MLKRAVSQKVYGATDETTILNRSFKFFDLDNDGGVSPAEFGKACEKLGVFIPTDYNLQQIFRHYDTNGNGIIEYNEFTDAFLGGKAPQAKGGFNAGGAPMAQPGAVGTSHSVDSLMKTLRARLKSRGARGIIGLGRSFRIMDDDRSRSLDPEEFNKAMKDYGTGFTDEEISVMFTHFDVNRDGNVIYDEFLRTIRGPLNPYRQKLVDQAWGIIDQDGNNQLDINDIKSRYNATQHPDVIAGKKREAEVLGEFLETFETHHATITGGGMDHIVTKEEWNEYYANVSSSVDRDDYFELMMNNAWKMNDGAKEYGKGWANAGDKPATKASDSYGQFHNQGATGGEQPGRSNWLGYKPQGQAPAAGTQEASRSGFSVSG